MNLINPLGRPSLPPSPTPSAVIPAKTPKSDFNQISGAMNEDHFIKSINSESRSTILRNVEGDLSGVEAASHVLALRRGQSCGKAINHDDLFSFSEVTSNNKVDLLIDREFARDGYFAAIRDAKESIHMAMLIIRGEKVGEHVADLLIEKKQENPTIDIRIILDAVGSRAILPWSSAASQVRRMRKAGIEVELNYPWSTGLEHRKLLVVDSKLAITGPGYLSDECFGNEAYWDAMDKASKKNPNALAQAFLPTALGGKEPFEITPETEMPAPHDYAFRLAGSSVHDLQANFLQSWLYHGRELEPELSDSAIVEKYFPSAGHSSAIGNTSLKLTHGIPKGISEMRQNMLAVVNAAQETLDIEIAYVVIPEFIEAVQEAAERGVKVRLLVNGQNTNIGPTWYYLRNNYPQLVASKNLELREFNQFTHCKMMIADSRLVFASTGNPEYNSWERGFDEIMLIDSPEFAKEAQARLLEPDMHPDRSTEIVQATLESTPWWKLALAKVVQFIYELFFTPREPPRPPRAMIASTK